MTTINVRIEEKTKKEASKTFAKLGLDMSGAIKLFLHQAVKEDGLPFVPTNDEGRIKARWDREAESAFRGGKRHLSARALHKDILK